jgi:hypothetical protein
MGYNKVLLGACWESIGNLGNMLKNQTLEKIVNKVTSIKNFTPLQLKSGCLD